jgi:hypothetical protein
MDVGTKREPSAAFGNDDAVDTKSATRRAFGNDDAVGTNCLRAQTTHYGFVRVRKRKLKGGSHGWLAKASVSFDLVRAVRVNGKPRHKFVLGLGSQKGERRGWHDNVMRFWTSAVRRMRRHGIPEEEQRRILAEMVRKGARPPTLADCEDYARDWVAGLVGRNWLPVSQT